jgi:hypothetical protein
MKWNPLWNQDVVFAQGSSVLAKTGIGDLSTRPMSQRIPQELIHPTGLAK